MNQLAEKGGASGEVAAAPVAEEAPVAEAVTEEAPAVEEPAAE